MKRLKWLCACIPLCFTFGGVAYANPSSGQTLEEVQQRKMEVEQQLESTNRTIGNIDKNYETLTAELQKIDGTMQDLELQKYELLSDIIFAKNEVYNLGKDKKELEEKIEKRKILFYFLCESWCKIDENGNYTQNWESGIKITGNAYYFEVNKGKYHFELTSLDKEKENEYYCVFIIYDVQNKPNYSNLIKIN